MSNTNESKTKKLDLFIIVFGALALITAVVFGFVMKSSPMSETISNIAFTLGFMAYIAYSYFRTSSYEKIKFQLEETINERNNEIQSLNGELQNTKKELETSKSSLNKSQSELEKERKENAQLKTQLSEAEEKISALSKEEKE